MTKNTVLFIFVFLFAFSFSLQADNLVFLDEAWENRGEMDPVIQALERARAMPEEMDNPEFLWKKARLYYFYGDNIAQERDYKLENFERGLELLEIAEELDDQNPDIFYWKASLTGMRGQTRGVLQSLFMVNPMKEALDKTIELDPDYDSAYFVLGILYREVPGWPLSIGDDKKSVEYLEKALSYRPNDLEWKYELALSLIENKERERARQLLEEIVNTDLAPDASFEWLRAQEQAKKLLEEDF